jgi:chemotaxis signal transduction protein
MRAHSIRGDVSKCIDLMKQIQLDGYQPTENSVVTLLQAHNKVGDTDGAIAVVLAIFPVSLSS